MKKKNEEVKEELELYREIMENIAAGVFLVRTRDGIIVYANPAMERIFGYSPGEMTGKHISTVNAPTDKSPEEIAQEIIQSLRTDGVWRGEVKNIKKDGTVFWSQAEVSTFVHPHHGEVWLATHQDITERKRIEDDLHESERKFRKIAENIPGMVFQWRVHSNGSTDFSYVSPRATELFGLPTDLSSPDWELGARVHSDDRESFFASVTQASVNLTNWNYEGRLVTPSGELKWFRGISSPVQIDDEMIFDGIMLDITERKRVENALYESEQRYKSLFKNYHANMLLINPDTGKIVDANPAASAFYGYSQTEFANLKITDLNTLSQEQVTQEMQKANLEERNHFFFKHQLKSGEVRDVEVYSGPIEIAGQKLLYSIIHDITKRKQMEEDLKKEEEFRSSVIQRAAEGICVCHSIPEFPFVHFTVWNEQMTQITGHSMEEINRHGWYQSLYPDPDYQQKAVARMDEMRTGKDLLAEEWNITRADGEKRTVTISTSVLLGDEGVAHVLAVMTDRTEHKRAEEALRKTNKILQAQLNQINILHETLREQAIRDSLTGLYNRRHLSETMQREISRAKRKNYPISVMVIDIDNFKEFNDSCGHDFGDEVLTALSALLRDNIRVDDIACRYGGDEFVVVMPDANTENAERRAKMLRQGFNAISFKQGGVRISATVSIGLSTYPQHGDNGDTIFQCADSALYQAKQAGRNRVQVWKGGQVKPYSSG